MLDICTICNGSGKIIDKTQACRLCDGTGGSWIEQLIVGVVAA